MAQFYAQIQGNRGAVTRMGTKGSGIEGHLRGWNVGARVVIWYDKGQDKDIVQVYKTAGSNYGKSDNLIAEFSE